MGNTSFLGPNKIVNTSQKFTVVTQFITSGNSDTGTLTEIRRLYVQNGKVIPNSVSNISSMSAYSSISDQFCSAQKTAFGDTNEFSAQGGMTAFGKQLAKGMVLTMSIWESV